MRMALKSLFEKCGILKRNPQIISVYLQQKLMSQYPSFFVKPVFRKEDQTSLAETGELQKLAHIPTRAALNHQTSSLFYDHQISLFINYVMKQGKKSLARDIVGKAFEKVKRIQLEKYHKANETDKENIVLSPKTIFYEAIKNCTPILQLTPIKRGGVRYQVPVPITDKRGQFLSMKWLIEAANEKERTVHFPEKLAYELIDAANNTGRVVKKKQDLHRQCEANRAYAHYRWS